MLTDPNQRATTLKNQDITKISVDCWKKKQREQTENNQNNPGNNNSDANDSNLNSSINNNNNSNIKNSNRAERQPKTVYSPCQTCGKTNHFTEKGYFGANATNRPPHRQKRPERYNQVPQRANESDSNESPPAAAQNLN